MKIIRRLISLILVAVFLFSCMPSVFASDDISSCSLVDSGVAVCPYCGKSCLVDIINETKLTYDVLYHCEDYMDGDGPCSYYSRVTKLKFLDIDIANPAGEGIKPSIVDGNAYWSVKADQVDKNPYYNEQQPTEAVIGPRGYKRIYVPVSYNENYLSATYAVTADEDAFIYSLPAHYGTLSSSNQYFCITHNSTSAYASSVFWGKSVVVDADGVYQTGLEIELLAGNIQLDRGSAARVYDVGAKLQYYGSKSSVRAGGSTRSYDYQVNLVRNEVSTTFYRGALIRGRYFVELVADLYGTPIDYTVVTNNNYINIENKTITVNNQEINYNNAYTYENNYYVYNSNDIPTVYITDDSGSIIGSCVYDAATSSYQIVLYGDYTEDDLGATATPTPTATPSPVPTASPAPTEAPSATDAPDNGGSGGDNSGSNGSNGGDNSGSNGGDNSGGADSDNSGSSGGGFWDKLLQGLWDRLFGGLIDGLVAILEAILQILLKLLGSIFSVLPLFAALLGLVFPFVPSSILGIVSTGLFLAVILGVVKFIRGFF